MSTSIHIDNALQRLDLLANSAQVLVAQLLAEVNALGARIAARVWQAGKLGRGQFLHNRLRQSRQRPALMHLRQPAWTLCLPHQRRLWGSPRRPAGLETGVGARGNAPRTGDLSSRLGKCAYSAPGAPSPRHWPRSHGLSASARPRPPRPSLAATAARAGRWRREDVPAPAAAAARGKSGSFG